MPLEREIFTSAKSVIGIWRMTESLAELKLIKLSVEDQQIFNEFKIEKRQKEWLAVRHTLKQISGNDILQIKYDEKRNPFLEDNSYKISISHCSNFVAVYIHAESEIGIDIEEVRNKILTIKEKFCSATELEFLSETSKAAHATICWSAKESLYKFYAEKKVDFKKHLILKAFELLPTGKIQAQIKLEHFHKELQINYLVDPEFILTYVST